VVARSGPLLGGPFDAEALRAAPAARSALCAKRACTVDGQPSWLVSKQCGGPRERALPTRPPRRTLRRGPRLRAPPIDFASIGYASPDAKRMIPRRPSLWAARTSTAVRPILEGERIVGAEPFVVEEPRSTGVPVEHLGPTRLSPEAHRPLANRSLLDAKAKTSPSSFATGAERILRSRVERREGDPRGHAREELVKDRAQRLIETNAAAGQRPRHRRQLAGARLIYQERIEILKPILAAMREELANRNR